MNKKKVISICGLIIISLYFFYLFFHEVKNISFDKEFCEEIQEDNYLVPSCDTCYNVTYDYSEICKMIEENITK